MSQTTTDYLVTGMTCAHCESAVRDEVGHVTGVVGVEVHARSGLLRVTQQNDSIAPADTVTFENAIIAAVAEAGYAAKRKVG